MAETSTQDKTESQDKPAGRVESSQAQAAHARVADREAREARAAAQQNDDDNLPLRGIAPYEPFDFMTLNEIQELANDRGCKIPDDVWKSLMISELRAHQSGQMSVARKRPA